MPLGLPRRSYDSRPSTSPRSSVVINNDGDSGDNGNRGSEKHRRIDHRRSASFNDAAPRPRVTFPLPGPLFKNLPAFYHECHRRSQPKPEVDTHTDNLNIDSVVTPPRLLVSSTDPFIGSPQGQPHSHHHHQPSRLLGFFTQSNTNHSKGSLPPKLQPSNVNGKEDSCPQLRKEATANRDISSSNMTSVASSTTLNKGHTTSPSKPSSARTYDAKLVTREMHRLGTLAGLSPAISPSLSSGPSTSTLVLPSTSPSTTTLVVSSSHSHSSGLPGANISDKDNPWGTLHVHVLPLFNEEPLRVPIEDLNTLVRRHIQTVLAASPSKALATLNADARELIGAGMVTLNAKLATVSDELLVSRLVELWSFFWDNVLPYVEGVLLPFQTDPLLTSLHRTPKQHRSSSPSRQGGKLTPSIHTILTAGGFTIDVRSIALCAFRDRVVMSLYNRLQPLLSPPLNKETLARLGQYRIPRLQQMLLVLTSERRVRPPSPTLSLHIPTAQPNAARHNTHNQYPQRRSFTQGITTRSVTPNFLSARIPGDRRGRIGGANMGTMILNAGRTMNMTDLVEDGGEIPDELDTEGVETPRIGGMERGDIPLALRPTVEHHHRASTGGWGLGAGKEERQREDDDDDEIMDWDQAQAVVERMVGFKHLESPTEARRRV
ncbi:HbrB-like-domain-containing protein [Scleroderma yunnanense]